jgi:hypothetical protein
MQIDVTVALVGDPQSPPPGGIDSHEWARPWEDRPKVALTVDDETPLSEVIDQAAEQLGSLPFMAALPRWRSFGWVAFDDQAAETPLYQRKVSDFTLLDEHGEAIFGIDDFTLVPYGQLARSVEAGLMPGDPRRLYIIRQIPQGDVFFGLSWEALMALYLLIRTVLDVVSTGEELRDRTKGAVRIVGRGLDALRRHAPHWGQRNGTPDRLRRLVQTGSWSSADLSTILACPENDLADILPLLGFTQDPSDGAWRRRQPDEEPLLTDIEDEIKESNYGNLDHDIDQQRLLRARVEEIVRHGRKHVAPTPLESYRIPEDELFPYSAPAPGWRLRIVWVVERLLRVR